MTRRLQLDPDRLFPADPETRAIARELYGNIADLPIVSPHGHTDAAWFANNEPFTSLALAKRRGQAGHVRNLAFRPRSGPSGHDTDSGRSCAYHYS